MSSKFVLTSLVWITLVNVNIIWVTLSSWSCNQHLSRRAHILRRVWCSPWLLASSPYCWISSSHLVNMCVIELRLELTAFQNGTVVAWARSLQPGLERVHKIYDPSLSIMKRCACAFLDRCRQHGVTQKPTKSQVADTKVDFGGFRLTRTGIHSSPDLLKSTRDFPRLRKLTDLRSWLRLVTNMKISCYWWSRLNGLGFVLLHSIDNVWKPVQAGSRFPTPAESCYDLEALAACRATKCNMFRSRQRLMIKMLPYLFPAAWVK